MTTRLPSAAPLIPLQQYSVIGTAGEVSRGRFSGITDARQVAVAGALIALELPPD